MGGRGLVRSGQHTGTFAKSHKSERVGCDETAASRPPQSADNRFSDAHFLLIDHSFDGINDDAPQAGGVITGETTSGGARR
jgi:hypothetical protein